MKKKKKKRLPPVRTYHGIVSFPDPDPHAGKGGKGVAHFEPFLGFADSTVQDPELPIRCDLSCDIGQRDRDIDSSISLAYTYVSCILTAARRAFLRNG